MIREKVVIPLLIALITGLLVGVLALAVGYLMRWERFLELAAISGLIISLLTWRAVLRLSGALPEADLSDVGNPTPERVRLQLDHQDGRGADWLDLPIDTNRMIAISERVLDGGSFSHASLAGQGKPLSRNEYEVLRDVFLSRGLVRWINPGAHAQGLRLTGKGRAVARGFASMAAADLPRLIKGNDNVTFYE